MQPCDRGEVTALERLLAIEASARQAATLIDLRHLIVNETRSLNRARQIFLAEFGKADGVSIASVSGIGTIDPASSVIIDMCAVIQSLKTERDISHPVEFSLPAFTDPQSDLAHKYPFREVAWVPLLTRDGAAFAGMLMTREAAWTSDHIAISRRLGATYAHAWRELRPKSALSFKNTRAAPWRALVAIAAAAALCVPVPMTALAPVEIVAADPAIVTSPLDGAIDSIDVEPNANVKTGDVLIRFADTSLRNRRDIAERDMAVASARVKQLTLLAFGDAKGRHELGLAESELELKRAELAFTTELLARTMLRAPRDGIVIYADKRSLIGKPVAVGERLMEIADPTRVEARIDTSASDAIALRVGGDAKLFLDADPLRPLTGRITRADHKARPSDADVLAFRAFAQIEAGGTTLPRIGLRGTAQIYGDRTPLAIVLFRRPLSAARQWLGL